MKDANPIVVHPIVGKPPGVGQKMPYRYLITSEDFEPFLTRWFDPSNHYSESRDMEVFDLKRMEFTRDGFNWNKISKRVNFD